MSYKIVVDALPSTLVMVAVQSSEDTFSFTLTAKEAEQLAYILLDRAQRAVEPEIDFMNRLRDELE